MTITFDTYLIAQILGYIAFGFAIVTFLSKNDLKLKILLTTTQVILAVHYFLIGANGGLVANAINAVRTSTSIFTRSRYFYAVFIVLYIGIGAYKYERPLDILPLFGSCMSTTGYFFFHGIKMRACALGASTTWIIYNTVLMNIAPLIMEVFVFSATAYRIFWLHRENRKARNRAETHLH